MSDASQYMKEHAVYSMLQNAVEDLLIKQPEDPITHLIGFFSRDQDQPRIILVGPESPTLQQVAEQLAKLLNIPLGQFDTDGWIAAFSPKGDQQAYEFRSKQPTHVIELSDSNITDPVYESSIGSSRDIFKSNITVVDITNLESDAIVGIILDIVKRRQLVLNRETREVLPAGPGLVDQTQELADTNMAKVHNTRPKIEEVE